MAKVRTEWADSVRGSIMPTAPRPAAEATADGVAVLTDGELQREGRKRLDNGAVIEVGKIVPDPHQPRVEFDPGELEQLAHSMAKQGQIQPIRVRWDSTLAKYVLVAGERRCRAAKLAGLQTLACTIQEHGATREQILAEQLIENCLRVDLQPVEQARAFKSLMEMKSINAKALADMLGISAPKVSKALALLDLPTEIQKSVDAGKIQQEAAYLLSKVEDPAEQAALARGFERGEVKRDDMKKRVTAEPRAPKQAPGPRPWTCTTAGGDMVTVAFGPQSMGLMAVLREALARAEEESRAGDVVAA